MARKPNGVSLRALTGLCVFAGATLVGKASAASAACRRLAAATAPASSRGSAAASRAGAGASVTKVCGQRCSNSCTNPRCPTREFRELDASASGC